VEKGSSTIHAPGRVALGASILCLVFLAACAYSFQGSGLPSHIKSVSVPNFGNSTLEPNIAREVTDALTSRFVRDGRLKLAPDSQSQAKVIGTVRKYENRVYNYTADQTPRDYIVVIEVEVEMRDQSRNRELWKQAALTSTAVYVPGGSPLGDEAAARAQAIRDLADDVLGRTMEQW